MVRSQEQKDRDTDKRIQRKFGITLADRNRIAEDQKHKCKICRGDLCAYGPPALDHFHFKVNAIRHFDTFMGTTFGWDAEAYDELGKVMNHCFAMTKAQALADVKRGAMPLSIRGLLCFKCNYALGVIEKFFNAARNPAIL